MPGYQTKVERIAVAGAQDLIVRSLLDRQQYTDPHGDALRQGISSATWPLFGLLWPSGAHLAARLARRPVRAGERILEIGCGLALASLVGHRRGADVTASDCHPLAEAFLAAARSGPIPSLITAEDLRSYRAIAREALCAEFFERRICSAAAPSSGGVAVLQQLGLLERTGFARTAPGSAEAAHLLIEAGRLARADRIRWVGDPRFITVPEDALVARRYLDARAALIRRMPRGRRSARCDSHVRANSSKQLGSMAAASSASSGASCYPWSGRRSARWR